MPDMYLTEQGDLALSPSGDFAITDSPWRELSQHAYISILTPRGDFLLYPQIGSELERLIGMPQAPGTGEFGKQLIADALRKMPRFASLPLDIKAVPTSPQSIRFDVYVTSGYKSDIVLSIEQNLGVE
jgi:phage baseplate assembly protein W